MRSFAVLIFAGSLSLGFLTSARPALAVDISGSGVWGVGTPVSAYSAPGDSFSFDFDVPNPTEANPSGLITQFVYDLDGVDVASASDAPFITFYDTANGGLFDLFFPTSGDDIAFEGAQIASDAAGTDTSGDPVTIADGSYTFLATLNFGTATTGVGSLAVPEPSSMLVLSAGLVALRAARRRSGGKSAT